MVEHSPTFFRETTLLVNPTSAAIRDEMNVERVIAHELAHQWSV